jgi:tetratricopeptide (TPR) repeat protein
MAMNKSRTSTTTKVLIIILIVALVGGVLLAGSGGLLGLFGGTNQVGQTTTGQPSATSYEGIAAKHQANIQANQAALTSNPRNYALLVTLGNGYFDWAMEVQGQQALANQALQTPLWTTSAGFYQRALAATRTMDPRVATDLSVALHYSGENAKAIALVTKVLKVDPKLPQAVLNAGQYYESAGQTATAVAYFKKYTTLKGTDAQSLTYAKGRVTELSK